MIILKNHVGHIKISREYLTSLIGNTVTACFGVVSMNAFTPAQTLRAALPFKTKGGEEPADCSRGVSVRVNKNKLTIELHISLLYGVNMNAVVRSIIHKVAYTVEESTGLAVEKVNVFVDDIRV